MHSWIRALEYTKSLKEGHPDCIASLLQQVAHRHPDRLALLGEEEQLTYSDLAQRSARYARWAKGQGLGKGDVVGLLMPNCPDYVGIWVGISRTGVAVALLNTNLFADGLLQGILAAGISHLIVGGALLPAMEALRERKPPHIRVWTYGEARDGPWSRIEPEIAQFSGDDLDDFECPPPRYDDPAVLIYTSGTTGPPKAAYVNHGRVLEWSLWFAGMMDSQPADRLYNCLPMYHSVGGIVAVGAMLSQGGSVVIRERFSASRFWDDVVDSECTVFQYIGELCRYLTSTSPNPRERQHQLRLACGNGLQGDVWNIFQSRFAISRILEFYAATEGVVSLYNCEGRIGAIGRIPSFLAHRFPVALVRSDPGTESPLRDADGLCIVCDVDEPGEAVGLLQHAEGSRMGGRYDGYTNEAETERKVLHDVFVKGDTWFRTGDLLRKDAGGFFYFVDRIGDTFRWRGENVSTVQVAEVIRAYPGVVNAVVYGVAVPGYEGRAGMAAVTIDNRFDLVGLNAYLAAHLPAFAQPLFLRYRTQLDVTGTFKPVKGDLVREGFAETPELVWFNDRLAGQFIPCDDAVLRSINENTRRL